MHKASLSIKKGGFGFIKKGKVFVISVNKTIMKWINSCLPFVIVIGFCIGADFTTIMELNEVWIVQTQNLLLWAFCDRISGSIHYMVK